MTPKKQSNGFCHEFWIHTSKVPCYFKSWLPQETQKPNFYILSSLDFYLWPPTVHHRFNGLECSQNKLSRAGGYRDIDCHTGRQLGGNKVKILLEFDRYLVLFVCKLLYTVFHQVAGRIGPSSERNLHWN